MNARLKRTKGLRHEQRFELKEWQACYQYYFIR